MPPPAHLVKKPARRALPRSRVGWNARNARFAKARDRFATPLNDLSFDDRLVRVRILMGEAYRMGRKDQADLEKLRRAR